MKRTNEFTTPKPKRVRKSVYDLPNPLPKSFVVSDFMDIQWKVGPVIGRGNHGLVSSIQENSTLPVSNSAEFVMKWGRRRRSTLFNELHALFQVGKADKIEEWKTRHHLEYLGVPEYISFGFFKRLKSEYRFIVIKRYGTDLEKLEKLLEANGKQFPAHTVFLIGLRLLDSLEYIHAKGLAHADIKGSNILLDEKHPNQVCLVDFGIARVFMNGTKHFPYTVHPKRKHSGTRYFTSRDGHNGVEPSCRGDMETLGYCMLRWLCSRLPWEDDAKVDKEKENYVCDQKILHMSNIPGLLQKCLPGKPYSGEFGEYLSYVASMGYEEKPDYDHCRQIFTLCLEKLGCKMTDKLDFGDKNSFPAIPTTSKIPQIKKINTTEMQKFQQFVEESIYSKPISCIPGITGALLVKLENEKQRCCDIFGQFLSNEDGFKSWLKDKYNARESQASDCARALYWYSQNC